MTGLRFGHDRTHECSRRAQGYPREARAVVRWGAGSSGHSRAEAVLHLDNAGAALPPRQVTEAVMGRLQREAAVGGYEAAANAAEQIAHTHDAIARLLRCAPDEGALTESANRAWDMAFYGVRLRAGDRVLCTANGGDGFAPGCSAP
jgi:selenocysteine lyase/cysteine desulfurase